MSGWHATVLTIYPGMFPGPLSHALAGRALELASRLRHPAYDCFYLALAEARSAHFVTADRRLLDRLVGTPWAERAVGLGH